MPYEFDGKKYEKVSAHQRQWGTKLIAELSLTGSERVLDLGCGDGANTAMIARLVPQGEVVGIDASQGMIDTARPKETANLRFILMDIDDLDFYDEFDVIYSNAALHWVQDHHRLLKNARNALKPNGILRFNFAGDGNCVHFFKVLQKAMELADFKAYFKNFAWPWYMPSVNAYEKLAKESGLQDVKVWGENADRHFPDTAALVGWIDQPSIVPLLPYVSDSDKEAFRNYVVEEMVKATREEDGRCFETFRRINLFARR